MRKYLHNHRGINYFIALRNITGGYPPKLKARLFFAKFFQLVSDQGNARLLMAIILALSGTPNT